MSKDAAVLPESGSRISTLQLDPSHTHIGFAVKHLMITTVRGRFARVSGVVEFNEERPTASAVRVTIDSDSIDTREERRDAHLRSADFLEAEKYPAITFDSTRIDGDVNTTFQLTGNLTIRGTTKPITLDVTREGTVKDPWGGRRTGYAASGSFKRSEFGLTWNQALETGGVVVGDQVTVTIELELIHQ